jgi:hypothetical protein
VGREVQAKQHPLKLKEEEVQIRYPPKTKGRGSIGWAQLPPPLPLFPRLGEEELLTMMMQNLPSSLRDAIISPDMCNRVVMTFDYRNPKPVQH